MADSISIDYYLLTIIFLNFILWIVMIILWILTARKDRELAFESSKRDRQLAMDQWKYMTKAEMYWEVLDANESLLRNLSIIKSAEQIEINEEKKVEKF